MEKEIEPIERKMLRAAEGLYSPALPYHNFEHAKNIVAEIMTIADRCKSEGVELNRQVAYFAALFHDAGYHLNHLKEGYETKEELSAALARQELIKAGISEEISTQVLDTILATHRDAAFSTNEQKALRAADLAGLAKNYEVFVRNTVLLKCEYELVHNSKITWESWKTNAAKLIDFYLSQDIRLTSGHDNEERESVFHLEVRRNLRRFLDTPVTQLEALDKIS